MTNPDAIPANYGVTQIPEAFEHPVIVIQGVSDEYNLKFLRQAAIEEAMVWVAGNCPEAIH